jgi:acyl carrier protein
MSVDAAPRYRDRRVDLGAAERRLGRLVAETLGTGEGELTALVSLLDGLAVDSLGLVELALQIETTFDVSLPERLLAAVRTYGDLAARVVDRVQYPVTVAAEPELVRAGITPASTETPQAAGRVLVLTPCAVQLITEDASRCGRGTRIAMTVPASGREPVLAHLHDEFADLAASGIEVAVDRDERWNVGTTFHPKNARPRRRPDTRARSNPRSFCRSSSSTARPLCTNRDAADARGARGVPSSRFCPERGEPSE